MTLALARPDLVRALVLVSTGARLRVARAVLGGLATDFEGIVGSFANFACGPDAPKRVKADCVKTLRSAGPTTLGGDLAACDGFDIRGDLSGIRVPTLVICGENDLLTPLKYSQYLAAGIAGASLTVVGGAGHMVMLQAPDAVAQSIAAFVGALA
jgi:pimeloyl-ACP methyl ester carboxylesterase